MNTQTDGMLMVVSGPAGVGKGTLVNLLLQENRDFHFSVSATTRSPRPGEEDGVAYHFLTDEQFDRLVAEDAFVEWKQVHLNRYGTLKSEVRKWMDIGENVVLDIDVQGAREVMKKFPECVTVFIIPESMTELRERLRARNTETPEAFERRMHNAVSELKERDKYDYIIVNKSGEMEKAMDDLRAIVQAERLSTRRFHPAIGE